MIVTTDETLRRYIPNALITVQGEVPLYDKLTPHLNAAQIWLGTYAVTEQQLAALADEDITAQAEEYICRRAFHDAIPDLDLVLTPNGFGIVSTQTIAPASRERVERLIRETTLRANEALIRINRLLRKTGIWQTDMPQGRTYGNTLCDWSLILALDMGYDIEALPRLLPELLRTEQYLKQHAFSPELYADLLTAFQRDTIDPESFMLCTDFCRVATRQLQNLFLTAAERKPEYPAVARLVQRIRESSLAAQWQQTDTARLWQPDTYQNTKNSGGYWF